MSYCLAFSEPEHGSDTAAGCIETRADPITDGFVVTGRKTWVSGADSATHALVLCRTPNGPARILVRLDENNVEIRPIQDLTGANHLFNVFFDGAHGTHLDGVLPQAAEIDFEAEFWAVVETARANGRVQDPVLRQHLAWAYAQVQILRNLPHTTMRQVLAAEYHRRLGEIAVDCVGSDALLRAGAEGYMLTRWQNVFLGARGDTLANGTSEILRDGIAEDLLELP